MEQDQEQQQVQKTDDIFAQRLAKLNDLYAAGAQPYGSRVDNITSSADAKAKYVPEQETQETVTVAGRIVAFRVMGKAAFIHIKDEAGKIQLFVQRDQLGEDNYKAFKKLDIGDIITADGELFTTKTGEITVRMDSYRLLSKSLRPLPEKWHGLTDMEQRYRQRYVDLIVNDDSREIFKKRIRILQEIRNFLSAKGFLEVETPMLQYIPGGAAANPFKTHYQALNCEMFLRIAPELYLKRLLVGGFEKVFELNRNFRNEGISRRHNPEFTMLELYQAYGNCETMMELVEEMITTLAEKVFGTLKIQMPGDKVVDLSRPWRRAPYKELIKERAGEDWFDLSREDKFKRAKEMNLQVMPDWSDLEITHEIYEKLIEHTLIQPTFVTRLPAELVPLAKKCPDDPTLVDVYELEINGQEISPGYTELNDPVDQRERFMHQVTLSGKDPEQAVDEDFLTALEYGMPPAGGLGIGIDRLVMLLTGVESIRDVVLFPQLRPSSK
ncbi:MAG: lysine--tRNA ligase [Lentisphaeria bacterium]|nr:lysine--tRNA ligase [Lentisphaeria bacterium]